MELSKKKKSEFDEVLRLENNNNFFLNVELLRKIFSSDFFEKFVEYTEKRISNLINNFEDFYVHIDSSLFCANDLLEYNKILIFSKMLHKFTENLKKIYIYNNSVLITNLIYLINSSLNIDITKKITFQQ